MQLSYVTFPVPPYPFGDVTARILQYFRKCNTPEITLLSICATGHFIRNPFLNFFQHGIGFLHATPKWEDTFISISTTTSRFFSWSITYRSITLAMGSIFYLLAYRWSFGFLPELKIIYWNASAILLPIPQFEENFPELFTIPSGLHNLIFNFNDFALISSKHHNLLSV